MNPTNEALQSNGEQFTTRYDLSEAEVQETIANYVQQPHLPTGRFIGVMVGPNDEIANVGRTLERSVFEETFDDNDDEFMQDTYGQVEENSRFIMVLDREDNEVAGVLRVVHKPPFITIDDAPDYIGHSKEEIYTYHNIDPETDAIYDIATLAIAPKYRGKMLQNMAINSMLYRMLALKGEQENVQHLVAMIDQKAHRALTNIGLPFEPMHGHDTPFEYKGSENTLALYSDFKTLVPGARAFYKGYHHSPQQFLDAARYFIGDRKSEKGRAAAKRLGLARVAGMIATGKNIDQNIHLAA